MKISLPSSNFSFKNMPFTSYILAIQSATSISTSTILIAVLFITGAAVDVRSKCFPSTCLNPLAFSQPQYVLLFFFLHASVDAMTFTPSGKSFLSKGSHTLFVAICLCSYLISSFHLFLSCPFIASLNFITLVCECDQIHCQFQLPLLQLLCSLFLCHHACTIYHSSAGVWY